MDSQSRILRHELNNIPNMIKCASTLADTELAEREVQRLVVRERMLPHLIAQQEQLERAAQSPRPRQAM